MQTASTQSTALFVTLVLALAALAAGTVIRCGARGGKGTAVPYAIGIVVAYLVVPGVLARAGLLDRYAPLPAPPIALILGLSTVTVYLALSGFGARIAASVGVASLVGFQSFRIVVEWLLHRLHGEGVIPVQMTWSGRNFDVVSGLTAAALGLWLSRRRAAPRRVLLAWNVLGLVLLANIVVIAVLSTPVPFRRFADDPPNLLPSTFPFVWLPSFLVQLALFGHLALFRRLNQRTPG